MEIAAAVLSGFLLAVAAPFVFRVARGATGWLLALLPLALFAYFVSYLGNLSPEGTVVSWDWAPSLGLRFSFLLDGLSLLFALLISGIGALILIYAGGYLHGDKRLSRLYAWLLVFMGSMLGVVLADNLLTLFVFWELTSISSYMLIGYDHERPAARAAALQALLVTGGGGLALLAGLLLLGQAGISVGLSSADSLELSSLLTRSGAIQDHTLYIPILILVAAGAFTKSAQFPFHFWLPNAMEAPTPVSAYLHSATMVKAGVYLLARLSPVLGGTQEWAWMLTGFGSATMLVGAVLAVQESDMKRILAYSTVSALGALVLLIGLDSPGAAAAAMAFLLAHSLYKAALFLVAGSVDHATGTRDIDQLTGLRKSMLPTFLGASVAALSMAGVIPMFGFVAKEMFYEATLHGPTMLFVTGAALLANMLFVVVAFLVGVRPFWGATSERFAHAHEGPASMWLGPLVLAALSITLGLVPSLVDEPLLMLASGVVSRPESFSPLKLALWHGWNQALVLSLITFIGGLALASVRERLRLPAWLLEWGPAWFYGVMLRGLNNVARWQTEVLQSGYLRLYVLTILITVVGFVGYSFFTHDEIAPSLDFSDVLFYEGALVFLVLMATIAAVRSRSRLSAIAALGGVGYGVALIFVLFGAPDLAMTQFLVETLTLILFVLVFYHLPPSVQLSDPATRVRDGVISALIGGMMTMLVLLANDFHFFPSISSSYNSLSVPEGHGRNVVNVILVDFRALDTLGEITVLASAGVGVYALLKLRINREGES